MDKLKHAAAAARSLFAVAVIFNLLKWTEAEISTVVLAVETIGIFIYAMTQKQASHS